MNTLALVGQILLGFGLLFCAISVIKTNKRIARLENDLLLSTTTIIKAFKDFDKFFDAALTKFKTNDYILNQIIGELDLEIDYSNLNNGGNETLN